MIALRLDKRFRFFHIDLLPEDKNFSFNYDSLATLDQLIAYNNSIGFGILLNNAKPIYNTNIEEGEQMTEDEKINNNTDDHVSQYKEISKKTEVLIAFEHYKINYIDKDKDKGLYEPDDNDDSDDEDSDDPELMGMIPQFVRIGQEKPVHYTPWGRFDTDNPLSPVNLYELRAMHFKGFTSKSIPNFSKLMSNIEGIAIWGQIDPYFIVIAPAKLYDFSIVRENIEAAIYGALNVSIKKEPKNIDQYIIEIAEKSGSMFENDGIENYAIIFPNKDFTVEWIENPTEKNEEDVCKLFSQIKDLIIFKNGEIYEC